MSIRPRLLAPVVLAVLAALPASAQTRDAPGRFTMQPIEGGFLRLDTQTGAVSTCRAGAENLVLCQPAQEEQPMLPHLVMPAHHDVRPKDVILRRLHGSLTAAADQGPKDFAGLLMVLAGLALVIWTELRAARRAGC